MLLTVRQTELNVFIMEFSFRLFELKVVINIFIKSLGNLSYYMSVLNAPFMVRSKGVYLQKFQL